MRKDVLRLQINSLSRAGISYNVTKNCCQCGRGKRSYGPRSMLTSAVGKDLCRPTPFLWKFKRLLRRRPWILQQRACFNTLFNYIYKVSLNVPVRQPRSCAARRAFVALSCWQRTHKTPIILRHIQLLCGFSLLHACCTFILPTEAQDMPG